MSVELGIPKELPKAAQIMIYPDSVVRDSSIGSLIGVGEQILGREPKPGSIEHWQGREITIDCDPPQTVQGDGEIWGETPVSAKVLPGVLPILTSGEQ